MIRLSNIIVPLVLSGCTTLAIPTTELYAKRFNSIDEFIANNFISTIELAGQDINDLRKNGVLWKARFNEMNTTYLTKPIKDIRTYCSSSGGALKQIGFENVEYVNNLLNAQTSPLLAFQEAKNHSLKMLGSEMAADTTGWAAYDAQIRRNSSIKNDTALAYNTLRDAAKNGDLGMFACEIAGKHSWISSVEVVRVRIGDMNKNGFDMPIAELKIIGKSL